MVILTREDSVHSLNSTVSVGRLSYKRLVPTCTQEVAAPPKKKVCFDEDENEYICDTRDHEPQHSEDASESATWYSAQDIFEFRSQAQSVIRRARKEREAMCDDASAKDQSFFGTLLMIYRLARKEEHRLVDAMKLLNYGIVRDEEVKELYKPKSPEDEERMLDMIGLEYQVILTIKKDSKYLRQSVQKVVKDIQRECHAGEWEAGSEALLEEFRDSLINFTQAPQLFAQLLAVAQYESFAGQLSL